MSNCNVCGSCDDDRRFGVCFECASSGEERAAKRTVLEHLFKAVSNILKRNFEYAKYDSSWALQRLTKTGDYAINGYFDKSGIDWRKS